MLDDYNPSRTIQDKIRELGMPQIVLSLKFSDGTSLNIPVLTSVEYAKGLEFSHQPEFVQLEIPNGVTTTHALKSETFTVSVDYGKGIFP